MELVSLVGFLLMIAGGIGLIARNAAYLLNPITIILTFFALTLMVWARITFGSRSFNPLALPTEGGLVTSGPYRFIRHPIYTAACLLFLGILFAHLTWLTSLFESLAITGAVIRIFSEEKWLAIKYPDYVIYSAHTKRMIPYVF